MSLLKIYQLESKNGQRCIGIQTQDGMFTFAKDLFESQDLIVSAGDLNLSDVIAERFNELGKICLGSAEEILSTGSGYKVIKPLKPAEVWAVGVTYRRQALEHDKDLQKKKNSTDRLYEYVHLNKRVEVFFKGFDRTSSGPFEECQLRADSQQVLPEAELVLVLSATGKVIAYTMGNDLTAWDIELECPLYLNQAKIWNGSGSLGPCLIPVECIPSPYAFEFKCHVDRNGERIISSSGNTQDLKRSLEEMIHYLKFNNDVPAGAVLFTGTTCVIPHDFALLDGDVMTVECEPFGQLVNTACRSKSPEEKYNTRL
ncbi:MAG: fumarylacetoacetate hydrolase family protein [Bdellovibrio sp.]